MKNLFYIFAIAVTAVCCNTATNSGGGTNTEANKARVQAFYDQVINAHNVDAIDSFCNADFVDHNPDPGHSGKGIDDLKASFKEFFAGFPDIHAGTDFMVAEGDTVVAHLTMTGTNSGPMGGMPATNKQSKVDLIDIIVLKDGKASERWGIFDARSMMQQLGIMPQQGMAQDTTKKK
ncbi:MAG TPA: ester cyclase [Parafilimonas sp.]|nr:ester cyclase [Parafilimonas sp.]